MDRFSPVAPAHIRVLVLPVGRIERARFLHFLRRLRSEAAIVRLGGLGQYGGDDEFVLSPKAFTQGSLLYSYSTSPPSEQVQQLAPYELYREPLLVLGLVDGLSGDDEEGQKELGAAAAYLRERHPRVVHRHLLLLQDGRDRSALVSDTTIPVANADAAEDASLKAAIGQLSVRFLREFTTYAQAMQASPSIHTPGQTVRSLQRTISQRNSDGRPGSGYATPIQSNDVPSPTSQEGHSRPPSRQHGSPATSFDQIPGVGGVASALARSDSRTSSKGKSGRASSQDRVSVQGFGQITSHEKAKSRSKARVGITVGSIYLMAGQWSEALRLFVEHTNKARALSDHLWHAKGLELIIVALLLHASAGVDFQIPSICYPIAERTSSGYVARFSANLPADIRPAEAARHASMRRLSTSLPDLLKLVLSLYKSGEGSLELPFLVISEATVRFGKLLASLRNAGDEVDQKTFAAIVENTALYGPIPRDPEQSHDHSPSSQSGSRGLSKGTVADMLASAQPTSDDAVTTGDHIAILAGIASVYAMLGMSRKKAVTLKSLIARLTDAINQARKLGAAELGMHPVSRLSVGTTADPLHAVIYENSGVQVMMAEVARIYGVELLDTPDRASLMQLDPMAFGNEALKLDIMRDMVAFCEASPDPAGLLRVAASLLHSAKPESAVESGQAGSATALSKDEQVRLTTTILRTVGIPKQVGCPTTHAQYWDPFLVRRIELITPSATSLVRIERSRLVAQAPPAQHRSSGNPLLYDPNAKISKNAQQNHILVQGEAADCLVMLQNPFEVSAEILSLSLFTEGVVLETSHRPITLEPARIQQVSLSVSPRSFGEVKITGCRVKVVGCEERDFRIYTQPWMAKSSPLVKEQGQDARIAEVHPKQKAMEPTVATLSATVIEPQPTLLLESTSLLDWTIMLLEGERQNIRITVRNSSNIAAAILGAAETTDALRLIADGSDGQERALIEPRECGNFTFEMIGKAGLSIVHANILYGSRNNSKYARLLSAPIKLTVNAALQAQHLDVLTSNAGDDGSLIVSFELGNAWPKVMSFSCQTSHSSGWQNSQDGRLAPGEVQRVYMTVQRWPEWMNHGSDSDKGGKALLERMRVIWTTDHRAGQVDLSGLTITSTALARLRGEGIEITLRFAEDPEATPATSKGTASARVGHFATIQAKLINHTNRSDPLFVQLHARISGLSDVSSDSRHTVVAGTLYRIIPPLSADGQSVVNFAVCPLLRGLIEVYATTRPALRATGSDLVADARRLEWTTQRPLVFQAV